MAGSRMPGPIGCSWQPQPLDLNDGTMVRNLSPLPGPIGCDVTREANFAAPTLTSLSWEQIKADMRLHESLIQHMYLDSVDRVTIGVGNMLPSLATAQALGFVLRADTSKSATKEQIRTDWDNVNAQAGTNKRASSFAAVTLLNLPEETCWSLLKSRIYNEFVPGLKRLFAQWDTFPVPAKRALLDMTYNLGLNGLRKFHGLISHVREGDWAEAATACSRRDVSEDRNQWTKARFLEATPPGVRT